MHYFKKKWLKMNQIINIKKESLMKKLSIFIILSIISICTIPLAIVLMIVIIAVVDHPDYMLSPLLMIIPYFLFSITPLLNFILGIIILATDWKNEEINSKKILWGILTLLLLGPIASLVFSVQSRKIYKSIDGILDDETYKKEEPKYNQIIENDEEDYEDE